MLNAMLRAIHIKLINMQLSIIANVIISISYIITKKRTENELEKLVYSP